MFITAIQMDLAARLLLQDSSRPVASGTQIWFAIRGQCFPRFQKACATVLRRSIMKLAPRPATNTHIYIMNYNL